MPLIAALILLLFACSAPQKSLSPNNALRYSDTIIAKDHYTKAPRLREQATTFDTFLQRNLSGEDEEKLIASCEKAPERNIFCFSILNAEHFENKLDSIRRKGKRRSRTVYPKIRKNKIKNWADLRYASVNATLRGLRRYSLRSLDLIKSKAFREKKCPVNIAISLAATLEDYLPDNVNPIHIARLYKKGTECLTQRPSYQRALFTRSGLFYFQQKRYKEALKIFTQVTKLKNTFLARALYWKYRTEKDMGLLEAHKKTLQQLIEKYPFSFHGLVAQTGEKMDPGTILTKTPTHSLRRSLQDPTINLLIEQVEILTHFEYEKTASRILDWALHESDDVEPELKIYLSNFRKETPQKIAILAEVLYENPQLISRGVMEQYFPKAFFPIFKKHSSGLDPYLLLAIARQESAFDPKARSSANALGLLQLLPSTGRSISKVKPRALYDPKINITVGSRYFQKLLKETGGQIHLALAAYNAGPKRIPVWTKRYQTLEPVLFIDFIPYRETREYVALVLRNYYWYRRLHLKEQEIKDEKPAWQRETTPRKR